MKGRDCVCGTPMAPTSMTQEGERKTLWHCRFCLNEEIETVKVVDPMTAAPVSQDAGSLLRGFVRVEQVIQGPKGGKIYRRMW